jgi:outer membrane protein assembly factor BamA
LKSQVLNTFLITLFLIITISACKTTKYVPDGEYLLTANKVEIKPHKKSKIKQSDIEGYIRQNPNTKIFYSIPLRLWIYNISQSGKKRKWKEKLLNVWAEPPIIYDNMLTSKTLKQIRSFLTNSGYFNAEIDTDIVHIAPKKVKVIYKINLNKPYKITSVNYKILDNELRKIILADTNKTHLKPGAIYNTELLEKERNRIVYLLKKNGYYGFNKNYVEYLADTDNYQVRLTTIIKNREISKRFPLGRLPHIKYKIGKVTFYTNYDNFKKTKIADTLTINNIRFIISPPEFISPKIIYKGNYIKPDEYYNIENVKATYNYLWRLNTYKLINIYFIPDSNQKDVIDCYIELSPFKKYTTSIELEGTNTSGNFGAQGNIQISDRSLFGNAEILTTNLKGSFQRQTIFTVHSEDKVIQYLPFNTIETGGNVKLAIPQFWLPINSDNFVKKYSPKTIIKTTINYQKRPDYENELLNGSYGYSWKFNENLYSTFNLLELNSVKVFNITPEFKEKIKGTFLEYSFVNHIIAATNYSLSFLTPLTRKNAFSLYGKLESSGNLLTFINKKRPKLSMQNDEGQYLLFNLPYSQYIKLDLDLRYYHNLKHKQQLAYRFFGGIAYPYGNMKILPFEKRYYAGGANGIRAWEIRTLGPGNYRDTTLNYPNQSGDMKLLFSWEYRFHLFWILNAALFADAGNIWEVTPEDPRRSVHFYIDNFYNQIAIGSGIGFRFDLTVFIFRLDFAMKVRDPAEPEGERWLPIRQKPSLNNFNFNIGIGYPF